jgi:Flp pilus assembly protein TadG
VASLARRCPGGFGAASASLRVGKPAQALVELVLVSSILVVVLFGVFETVWWAYAQNVVTAAVQDGAYRASAQNGDLGRGQQRAENLLSAGLGPSAALVQLTVSSDAQSVSLSARGQWPVATIAGVQFSLPLHAEARMLRARWQP